MSYFVYLVASKKGGVLYLGVTNDLVRRIYEHKTKAMPGFTSRYNVTLLVWFEVYDDPVNAISREKEIKKWRRAWKVALIEKDNPDWRDVYDSIASSIACMDELAEIPGSRAARARPRPGMTCWSFRGAVAYSRMRTRNLIMFCESVVRH